MDLGALEGQAVSLLLHLLRTAGFFIAVPLFGRMADTAFVRLILVIALGSVFWCVDGRPVAVPASLLEFGLGAVREAAIGLSLGFALSLLTATLVAAGEIIGNEMGFSMARVINPDTGLDASVVSQLLQVFGFMLILGCDLHHEALRVLEHTFAACPVGGGLQIAPLWDGLQALVGSSLLVALQYAFPVVGVMLLLTVGLVLLGRAIPHLNLMEFGFGVRVLIALLAACWFLAEGTPFLLRAFAAMVDGTRAMFPAT